MSAWTVSSRRRCGSCRRGRARAALDAIITQQAQIIAYIDDFKLLMIATLVVIPLLFKRGSRGATDDTVVVD